jgi:hypothetical protein
MPNTISITDTVKGRRSVTNDIQAVLRKIEYWHQGSIAGFKIMYCDENGVWDGVRWDGRHPVFFAIGERDEGKARAISRLKRTADSSSAEKGFRRSVISGHD